VRQGRKGNSDFGLVCSFVGLFQIVLATLRRNVGGLKMVLNAVQIKKFTHILRNTNCMMTCHAERVAVVSGS
jgi:hypothetical protein